MLGLTQDIHPEEHGFGGLLQIPDEAPYPASFIRTISMMIFTTM